MLDDKYERYWDEIDIDNDWKEFLNNEHDDTKKDQNTYYRYTRSFEKMGEELVYQMSSRKYIQNEPDYEFSEKKEQFIKGVSIKKLISVVSNLNDKQKLALELYIFRGYKQEKIAEIMNCTQENISVLISRTLAKIAKKLSK